MVRAKKSPVYTAPDIQFEHQFLQLCRFFKQLNKELRCGSTNKGNMPILLSK